MVLVHEGVGGNATAQGCAGLDWEKALPTASMISPVGFLAGINEPVTSCSSDQHPTNWAHLGGG